MTLKINKELLLKRSAATRYLVNEVFPADVPAGVRYAVAGKLVTLLTDDSFCSLPAPFPDFVDLTEEVLMVEGTDYTFRQLPGGSWAVLSIPTELGGEHTPVFVVDAPVGTTGPGSLPEIYSV
jgi:hypothetical protein